MVQLGRDGGHRRRLPASTEHRSERTRQRHRAEPGDERAVHEGARIGALAGRRSFPCPASRSARSSARWATRCSSRASASSRRSSSTPDSSSRRRRSTSGSSAPSPNRPGRGQWRGARPRDARLGRRLERRVRAVSRGRARAGPRRRSASRRIRRPDARGRAASQDHESPPAESPIAPRCPWSATGSHSTGGLDRGCGAASHDDLAARSARARIRRVPRAGHRRQRRRRARRPGARTGARPATARALPRARARERRASRRRSHEGRSRERPGRGRRGDRRDRRRDSRLPVVGANRARSRCHSRRLGSRHDRRAARAVRRREVHPRQRADRRRIAPRNGRGRPRRSGAAHDDAARARPPPERRGHRRQPRHARGASLDRRRRSDRCVRRHRRARARLQVHRLQARDRAGMRRPRGARVRRALRGSGGSATRRSSASWPSWPSASSDASALEPGGGRQQRS